MVGEEGNKDRNDNYLENSPSPFPSPPKWGRGRGEGEANRVIFMVRGWPSGHGKLV
jgi:hypothetical protein